MNRAAALIEARRRWGEHAWICGPRRTDPAFVVGFAGPAAKSAQHTMGEGSSWEEALAAADAVRARTGLERVSVGRSSAVAVVYRDRPPTLADSVRELGHAKDGGLCLVAWYYTVGDYECRVSLSICECGEPTICDDCPGCTVADYLTNERPLGRSVSNTPDDLEARVAAGERLLGRIGSVLETLRRQLAEAERAQMATIEELFDP